MKDTSRKRFAVWLTADEAQTLLHVLTQSSRENFSSIAPGDWYIVGTLAGEIVKAVCDEPPT